MTDRLTNSVGLSAPTKPTVFVLVISLGLGCLSDKPTNSVGLSAPTKPKVFDFAVQSALLYVYNSLVDFIKSNATLGSMILNAKNQKEVGAKYAQYCKEAVLLNSFLSSNNGN